MECNLCWAEFDEHRHPERCPWCLNPIEGEMEQVGEDWKDRPAVVRGKEAPALSVGGIAFRNLRDTVEIWMELYRRHDDDYVHLTPLEAHRLARWILGNVDLPDGVEL